MINYRYRELSNNDKLKCYILSIIGFGIGALILILSVIYLKSNVVLNIFRLIIGFAVGVYWAILVRFIRNVMGDEYIYLSIEYKPFRRVKLKDMPDEIFLKVLNNRRRGIWMAKTKEDNNE